MESPCSGGCLQAALVEEAATAATLEAAIVGIVARNTQKLLEVDLDEQQACACLHSLPALLPYLFRAQAIAMQVLWASALPNPGQTNRYVRRGFPQGLLSFPAYD